MNKIISQLNSLKFMHKMCNLLYSLSQLKYIRYQQYIRNLSSIYQFKTNIIQPSSLKTEYTDQYVILIFDNRNNKFVNLFLNSMKNVKQLVILCTSRSYFLIKQTMIMFKQQINEFNKYFSFHIIEIPKKFIYDLNIYHLNVFIRDNLIKYINIDFHYNYYCLTLDDKIRSISNHVDFICNDYDCNYTTKFDFASILFFINFLFCNYFLNEIGKNKKSKEKIENQMKLIKLQLLNVNCFSKKKKTNE